MADSESSNEIQIISVCKRQKVINSSDSKSDDGMISQFLTVDPIDKSEITFIQDDTYELDDNDDDVVANAALESESGKTFSLLKVDKNERNENIFIGEEDQLESDQGKSSELILTLDQDVVNVQESTLFVNSVEEDEDDGLLELVLTI
jgi:hypothetical protein